MHGKLFFFKAKYKKYITIRSQFNVGSLQYNFPPTRAHEKIFFGIFFKIIFHQENQNS